MLPRECEPEPSVVELGTLERRVLIVTLEAVLRFVTDRMVRCVAIDARALHCPLAHLCILVTLDAGLIGVLAFESQPGVLGVFRPPAEQQLASQRLSWLVAEITFLRQLGTFEAVDPGVTTLAVRRVPEETHTPGLQTPDVTLSASNLAVMLG